MWRWVQGRTLWPIAPGASQGPQAFPKLLLLGLPEAFSGHWIQCYTPRSLCPQDSADGLWLTMVQLNKFLILQCYKSNTDSVGGGGEAYLIWEAYLILNFDRFLAINTWSDPVSWCWAAAASHISQPCDHDDDQTKHWQPFCMHMTIPFSTFSTVPTNYTRYSDFIIKQALCEMIWPKCRLMGVFWVHLK